MSSLDQDLALASLTPEERAAVLGDDLADEDLAALERIAAADDAPGSQPAVAQLYQAHLPEDFELRLRSLAEREEAIKTAYRGGELDFDDFDQQREALAAERASLSTLQLKAEIAREMAEQTASAQWQKAIDDLANRAATPAGGGIDYRQDAQKAADLDSFVRILANNPANADKSMTWFLEEAHRRVLTLHGGGDRRGRDDAHLAQRHELLADIGGAAGRGDVAGAGAGEFDHLDRLEGLEYEEAIARMTDRQRERYLRGQ